MTVLVESSGMAVVTTPEQAPVEARLNVWHAVPGLSTGVASVAGDNLEITVSAETYQAGGSVWFRAVVDGEPALPSDVTFKSGATRFDGIRRFTFVKANVGAGQHIVEIQWRTGSSAQVRDRTLTVNSGAPAAGNSRLAVGAAPSGPLVETSSTTYQDIPGLPAVAVAAAERSTLAVSFSAEAFADSGRMMIRALDNGSEVGEVIFCEGGDPGRHGALSFTFAKSLLAPGEHSLKLQWKSTGGVCRLGDRTVAASAAHFSAQNAMSHAPASAIAVTSQDWVNVPVITRLHANDSVTSLAITFSAEVLSNLGRMFVRALVNGVPASPSDVTLIEGGPKWRTAGHTFVLKNLKAGTHEITVQARVDASTSGRIRRCSLRTLKKRRSGSDFVQSFLGMVPRVRTYRMLVIGFDPVRPAHPRPAFALLKAHFEGKEVPVLDPAAARVPVPRPFHRGPNVRDWLAENSGGKARLGAVRYVGCSDDRWFVASPDRQGDWYWTNSAFEQMWKDALAAADLEVDFHSFDTDHNNALETDDLLVAIVRPQTEPYGTLRGTSAVLDATPTPLRVPVLDLYLSHKPENLLWGVGLVAHELAHLVNGTVDLYGSCPAVSPGFYSVMDQHSRATHLDPFHKMKNGMVQPHAIDLTTQASESFSLPAVETNHKVLLLHDASRVADQYFLIENRFPGTVTKNYDAPLGSGAVVVWQVFENLSLVKTSAVCQGDPRFIRRRAVLLSPADTVDLKWADGTPVGFRVSAPVPNAQTAEVRLERVLTLGPAVTGADRPNVVENLVEQ